MKKIILSCAIALSSFLTLAQDASKIEAQRNLAELQTKEIMEFFQLGTEHSATLLNITLTYLDKNVSLSQTDMHEETKKMGRIYNKQQKDDAIKALLSENQRMLYEKFEGVCDYCLESK